jgi:4-hydroxybenzoate polyprenyltransferase
MNHIRDLPLCVDLDGSLIRSDALVEGLLALLRERPWAALAAPLWIANGRAAFKRRLAELASVDPATLPYHEALLEYLRAQHGTRSIVLCTATDTSVAERVAAHVGLFDEVIASDGRINAKGEAKAALLVARFGERGFDYVGNESVDLAVWKRARRAIVVSPDAGLAERARSVSEVERVFDQPRHGAIATWVRALRAHQWVKNVLLFVPLLAAHRFTDLPAWGAAALAFLAFSLCASAVYLLNDLLDLPADRHHPRKRHRPLAAGTLPLLQGLIAIPLLLLLAAALAMLLPAAFGISLACYFAITLAYSLYLKRIAVADTMTLAALYTLRIIAGAFALGPMLSFWLLAFSMFLFLSLAMIKRHAELTVMRSEGRGAAAGRGYVVDDLAMIATLGGASGYLSVLVLALYINSEASQKLYAQPVLLWLLCPLLLYWISRAWMITHRGAMHDDPIVFAFRDRTSLLIGALGLAVVLVAI